MLGSGAPPFKVYHRQGMIQRLLFTVVPAKKKNQSLDSRKQKKQKEEKKRKT